MEKSIRLESSWDQVKEKIKETHPEITDADLEFEHGHEDVMYERLSQKLHTTKQGLIDWIESISSNKVIAG
jgi:hypothetical protein